MLAKVGLEQTKGGSLIVLSPSTHVSILQVPVHRFTGSIVCFPTQPPNYRIKPAFWNVPERGIHLPTGSLKRGFPSLLLASRLIAVDLNGLWLLIAYLMHPPTHSFDWSRYTVRSDSHYRLRRALADSKGRLVWSLSACVLLTVGCRAPVQREVYSKRMAHEIRVLEDQLYDADYQNRVLRDELTRVKENCEPASSTVESAPIFQSPQDNGSSQPYGPSQPYDSALPPPVVDPQYDSGYSGHAGDEKIIDDRPLTDLPSNYQMDHGLAGDRYAVPSVPYVPVPEGTASSGGTIGSGVPDGASGFAGDSPTVIDADVQPTTPLTTPPLPTEAKAAEASPFQPRPDSEAALPAPKFTTPVPTPPVPTPQVPSSSGELPAPSVVPVPPGEPEPPGPSSFKAPPLLPGNPIPPAANGGDPPGAIPLPQGVKDLIYSRPALPEPAQPQHIQLHSGLSGGHQFDQDDEIDGMYLVINVIDNQGHAINLRDFDINASLTVVVLDPAATIDGTDATSSRVGRWDFDTEQISTFVRSVPVDGLHIPIEWLGIEPVGDEVVVHVRLQAESEEMRCQGRVQLKKDNAIAKWMPRGEKLR